MKPTIISALTIVAMMATSAHAQVVGGDLKRAKKACERIMAAPADADESVAVEAARRCEAVVDAHRRALQRERETGGRPATHPAPAR